MLVTTDAVLWAECVYIVRWGGIKLFHLFLDENIVLIIAGQEVKVSPSAYLELWYVNIK